MKSIKIKCPAKINLNLKILGKRPDGFHDIESVMQTINLYDYLTIEIEPSNKTEIILSGNSDEIPYDENNLVYKAAKLFLKILPSPLEGEGVFVCEERALQMRERGLNNKIKIRIEKHIPVAAGLAGGSTDAAGTLYGLNELFDKPYTNEKLHELCAQLGSDLNVCLQGGRILAKGRGEILESQPYEEFNLSIIKPRNLGISAKEAYTKFSLKDKTDPQRKNFVNDLEWAVIEDYKELQYIKRKYPDAVMTGSGSVYYIINKNFEPEKNYIVINGLQTVPYGVKVK